MIGRPSDVEKKADATVDEAFALPASADSSAVSRVYEAKCALVNQALREIGMGRYQWQLFVLSGFGWAVDNWYLQGVAIILPEVGYEFNPPNVAFMTLALYAGLICGAFFWGSLADIIGRRFAWNLTLGVSGIFGIAAGAAPSFASLGVLLAFLGFGVGGNLPVDGALYLEFIPQNYQWTLTLLSAFWACGQLYASLLAYAFITNYSCPAGPSGGPCPKSENMGWRYTFYTLGATTFVMFILRFLVFNLQESPKYLIGKNRDSEAYEVLQFVAKKNGVEISLTLEQLQAVEVAENVDHDDLKRSNFQIIKDGFSIFTLAHLRPLYATSRLAVNTTIVFALWSLIGLAYPLYNAFLTVYLSQNAAAIGDESVSTTYRNYAIISVMGIPGSLIGAAMVDWQPLKSAKGEERSIWIRFTQNFGGRKFAMASSTLLLGIFLFLFTTARTNAATLGWNCAAGLLQNIMYGVLYAYTPELFPGPHRGTGDAVASSLNRVFGLMAPIIKIYSKAGPSSPIYVSAALFIVSSGLMLLLPIETAGVAAL